MMRDDQLEAWAMAADDFEFIAGVSEKDLIAELRLLRALLSPVKTVIDGFRRPQQVPPDQWHDAYAAAAEVIEKLGVEVDAMRTPAQDQIRAIVLELATLGEWDYEPAQVRDIVARARAAIGPTK